MKLKDMIVKLLYQRASDGYAIEFDTSNGGERRIVITVQEFFEIISSLKLDTIISDIVFERLASFHSIDSADKAYSVKDVLEIINELEQEHPHLFI